MDEKKERFPRNARTEMLLSTLARLGYTVKKMEYRVDDNEQDEETASQTGIPFLELTLSL